jgi:hypothetical protein
MSGYSYEGGRLNLPFVGFCTFAKAPVCEEWNLYFGCSDPDECHRKNFLQIKSHSLPLIQFVAWQKSRFENKYFWN